MLSAPKDIYGAGAFEHFLAELGMDRVCKILGVHPNTVRGWKRGAHRIPKMAVLALYWETQYGRSLIECEMVNEIRLLYQRNQILQRQLTRANDMVTGLRRLHAGTANEPLYEELMDCHENEAIPSQFVSAGAREHSSAVPAHQNASPTGLPAQPQADQAQATPTLQKVAAA
jgi:hypothetical protein